MADETQEHDTDEFAVFVDPEEQKRIARQKRKQTYISLHNPDKPNEVKIGGMEIPLDGTTYLLIEINGGQPPRYVVGRGIGTNLIAGEVLKDFLDVEVKGPPQDDTQD